MSILFPLQLMLVNPKKLDSLTIDGNEANMQRVNVTGPDSTKANVPLILFKHLTKREDVINLFYTLTHEDYSLSYSNLVLTKMVEKIKEFFVTNAANTSILNWNQPNKGLYGWVFDPTFVKNTTMDAIRFLSVGGFDPELRETYNFKTERINSFGILLRRNWKMDGYADNANLVSEAQKIQIPAFVTAVKFTLAKYQNQYTYTRITPTTTRTETSS